MRIESSPTQEEAAAIMAALEFFQGEDPEGLSSLKRSRWRLAGLLGHAVEPGMNLEGDLWSYSRWEVLI